MLAYYCQLKETTTTHSLRFVIGLLQWQKVCKLGGDELHRPPRGGLEVLAGNLYSLGVVGD